jgi:predicted ATPase with chaperone activity
MSESISEAPYFPRRPLTQEDLGIPENQIYNLILRILAQAGPQTGADIAQTMRVSYSCINKTVLKLSRDGKIQSQGTDTRLTQQTEMIEAGLKYSLVPGEKDAVEAAKKNSLYVGPLPVSLEDYTDAIVRQALPPNFATKENLRHALASLVLSDETIDLIGPALNSRSSIFVYGNPGNGKSTIARSVRQLVAGGVYLPVAIADENHIIKLYDPAHHNPLRQQNPQADPRWILCQRPFIQIGGELKMSMLDLTWNETSRYYEAPLQLKANSGMLLIDDFGRQEMPASAILNRFIIPLEEGLDYLNLSTIGKKIEIPFGMILFFSTNIQPKDLAEEAFLRRIRHKIKIPDPLPDQYKEIFIQEARRMGFANGDQAADFILEQFYPKDEKGNKNLRGCHPRDILLHVAELAGYLGEPLELTQDLIRAACLAHFVDEL